MNKQLKGLFIAPSIGLYGSERSLSLLVNHFSDCDATLMIPKAPPYAAPNNTDELKRKLFPKTSQIVEYHLPKDFCFNGAPEGFVQGVKNRARKIFWHFFKKQLYEHLEHGRYDFIHLNSIVLHTIISPSYPFYLHVRECFNGNSIHVENNLEKARGIICIDPTTQQKLPGSYANQIVLNNPIDMRGVETIDPQAVLTDFGLSADQFIFSVIGSLIDIKGVEFIIRGFRQLAAPHARLLIVGEGPAVYKKKCHIAAEGDPRIIFYGEIADINKVYRISDCIIRGDPYFAIGRTVFEGLYSGCHLLIPGTEKDGEQFSPLQPFNRSLHFYEPRNLESFTVKLEQVSKSKVGRRLFLSNVADYVTAFRSFVSK